MYEAPLVCHLNPDVNMPHSYIIRLARGHSLEQHGAAIIKNPDIFVHHVYAFIEEQVYYIARPANETLLSAIRSDPNVEDVQCEPDIILF